MTLLRLAWRSRGEQLPLLNACGLPALPPPPPPQALEAAEAVHAQLGALLERERADNRGMAGEAAEMQVSWGQAGNARARNGPGLERQPPRTQPGGQRQAGTL